MTQRNQVSPEKSLIGQLEIYKETRMAASSCLSPVQLKGGKPVSV